MEFTSTLYWQIIEYIDNLSDCDFFLRVIVWFFIWYSLGKLLRFIFKADR